MRHENRIRQCHSCILASVLPPVLALGLSGSLRVRSTILEPRGRERGAEGVRVVLLKLLGGAYVQQTFLDAWQFGCEVEKTLKARKAELIGTTVDKRLPPAPSRSPCSRRPEHSDRGPGVGQAREDHAR